MGTLVKLLAWIKEHWVQAATIAIGLIITVWAVGRSCRVEDKYSRLKGTYEAYRKINAAGNAQLREVIDLKEKRIVQLDRQIATLNTDVSRLHGQLSVKDKDIKELEGSFAALNDVGAKLFNMTQQRDAWVEKFTLAEAVIADREHQITLLNLKCDELWGIAESNRKMYENERALRMAAEDALRACGGKLKTAKFWGGAKNVVVGVAAGYIVYQAVRK